jgi:hypothetical protein
VGGDHRSKYREDVVDPGRQDINPVFRSADIIVAPSHPFLQIKDSFGQMIAKSSSTICKLGQH